MTLTSQPMLSRSEWKAVAIAFNDAADRGCALPGEKSGVLGRVLGAVTGIKPLAPLADPRLEAIRGFVCDTRRHRRPADRYVPVLEAQGFSHAQVEALALLSL